MRSSVVCAAAAASALLATPASAQSIADLGGLKPGRYAVGFTTEYLVDSTRRYAGLDSATRKTRWGVSTPVGGRPVRVFVWYPARATPNTDLLPFGGYLAVQPSDPRLSAWNRELLSRDSGTARRQFTQSDGDSAFAHLLRAPTWASWSLPSAGRFPLVVHSLGLNDYQLESTALWELLASHGYVVAVVPQLGAASPARMTFGVPAVRLQTADVEFVLGVLKKDARVDSAKVGLLGHSIGGLVALAAASTRPDIRAIVTLDGSATMSEGKAVLDSIGWRPSRSAVLDIHRSPRPRHDLSALEAMTDSRRYVVSIRSATHFDFQNWPLYESLSAAPDQRGAGFRSSEVGRGVVAATAALTLDFLNAELKGETGAGGRARGELPVGSPVDSLLTIRVLPPSR